MKKLTIFFLLMIIILTSCIAVEAEETLTKSPITFDKTIGACGFIDDPINSVLSGVGTVREYHNYRWITEKANECRFTQGTWWDWDEYYKNLHDIGVDVVPCIQGTSQADRKGYNGNKQQKPIDSDEDSLDAASYKEHAQTMFQFAARYGSTKVDDSKLLLENGQKRVSGLGYIEYYENWNEPDKTWEGDESHFSGAEYAAMCSADYDGHEGSLGDTYGIKNADPNSKLVMGGIAGGRWTVEYLEEMKTWAEENRQDKKIPIDVINFHMYSGKDCPEKYEYIENFEKIANWRDENAPDLEIWMTEFGWDTNTASPHGATQENQRDWLIRTYLIANAHGIDRSTMYMSRDTGSASSTGKYGTSGLTTQKGEWKKKASWYGVATLKKVLKDFVFDEVILENDDIYVYKFKNINSNEDCFVIWSPTQDGSKIDNCLFNIEGYSNPKLIMLQSESTDGQITDLEVKDDNVIINVSETPIFVKVESKKEEAPVIPEEISTSFKLKLSSDKDTVKPGENISVKVSFDELICNENSKGIIALTGKFEYDAEILEMDLNSIKGLNGWNLTSEYFNPENLRFITDRATSVKEKEDIFEVTFKVKEETTLDNVSIKITGVEAGTGDENGLIVTDDAELLINIQKEEPVIKGDIDGNGKIDSNDLAMLKLYCIDEITLNDEQLKRANLDNDNVVTINDVAILKLIIIGVLTNE